MDEQIERCKREIAAIEAELLAGNPDVPGLLLALGDWQAEWRLLEAEQREGRPHDEDSEQDRTPGGRDPSAGDHYLNCHDTNCWRALIAVYIILAILYESYIHPITIISSLPAASVGALLALLFTHTDLSIIAIIGIILLIGIVKKNAILMIDFAIEASRNEGKNSYDSIVEACTLRFRPILMTTMAALLGALPLTLGSGTGSELRRPLGIAIIGGLVMSQALTLYTTPVVYLYFDSFQKWWRSD